MVGNERIIDRLARRPRNDCLRYRSADLIDLSRHDAAGPGVVSPPNNVDVALDETGDRSVTENNRQIPVDDLTRLDDNGAEVGSTMKDRLAFGRRGRGQRAE